MNVDEITMLKAENAKLKQDIEILTSNVLTVPKPEEFKFEGRDFTKEEFHIHFLWSAICENGNDEDYLPKGSKFPITVKVQLLINGVQAPLATILEGYWDMYHREKEKWVKKEASEMVSKKFGKIIDKLEELNLQTNELLNYYPER